MAYLLFMPSVVVSTLLLLMLPPQVVNSFAGDTTTHHCLVAQRLCLQDTSCSAMLQSTYEACGHVNENSCYTSDMPKCTVTLTALRRHRLFLRACVCTDESSDVQCHVFRDYILNNPCHDRPQSNDREMSDVVVFPQLLPKQDTPSCNFAINVCLQNDKCRQSVHHFHRVCKTRGDRCEMRNRVRCQRALEKLQMTPLYGCHCHRTDNDIDCERIYTEVNANPCIDALRFNVDYEEIKESTSTSKDVQPDANVPSELKLNPSRIKSRPALAPSTNAGHHKRPRKLTFNHPVQITKPELDPQDAAQSPTNTAADNNNGTCTSAQKTCEQDAACHLLLENVYLTCDETGATCNRTECMAAVRNFYHLGNPDKTYDIAFCHCGPREEECLVSQRRLHPPCAQSGPNNHISDCREIVQMCETTDDCKHRRFRFSEACAVDMETLRCRRSSKLCQKALVETLGTPLRTWCSCSATSIDEIYRCTEIQREVWINPCVVQSQKEFLENRVNAVPMLPRQKINMVVVPPVQEPLPPTIVTLAPAPVLPKQVPLTPRITTITTTTKSTLATLPPNGQQYCTLPKSDGSGNISILVGHDRRWYKKGEPDCSYVCVCKKHDDLICKTLPCTERRICQTTFAVYSHASPAYQAYRGRCICYSGDFICMKPSPQLYTPQQGVFLFLGYSEVEEKLLKPQTKLSIADSIQRIREIVESQSRDGLFKHIDENIVMQGYLDDFVKERENNTITESMVLQEKEQCYPSLKNLTDLINSNDPDITKDVAMSLFKLAEVEVYIHSNGQRVTSSFLSVVIVVVSTVGNQWPRVE